MSTERQMHKYVIYYIEYYLALKSNEIWYMLKHKRTSNSMLRGIKEKHNVCSDLIKYMNYKNS